MTLKPLGRRPWKYRQADRGEKPPLSQWLVDEDTGIIRVYMEVPDGGREHISVLLGSNSMMVLGRGKTNIQRSYSFPESVDPLKGQASMREGVLEVILHPCDTEIEEIHRIEID